MRIEEKREENCLTLLITGRLEKTTAPQLQTIVETGLDGVAYLKIDMEGLEYVSSAGLRVLLAASKKMKAVEGSLVVTGANESVREVFMITGFDTILDVR